MYGKSLENGESRRGGGADEKTGGGIAAMVFAGQFQGDADFADADGMEPDAAGAEAFQGCLIDHPEALEGPVPVAAALADPHEVAGKKDQ